MAVKPKLTAYQELAKLVDSRLPDTQLVAEACERAYAPSLEWIGHYLSLEQSNDARLLLEASYSAAIETVSLLAFGIARSAVFSIRGHYEFYLMYIYYCTHPVELNAAMTYRDGMKLPGEVKKYIKDYFTTYESRWKALIKTKTRTEEDYYGVLSAVAHGSALDSLPTAATPKETIASNETLGQFPALIGGVAESLFDISVSIHEKNWSALPDKVRERLTARFGKALARNILFK